MTAALPAASQESGNESVGFAVVAIRGATVRYTLSLPGSVPRAPAVEGSTVQSRDDRDSQRLLALVERAITVAGDGQACAASGGRSAEPAQPVAGFAIALEYRCPAPPRVLSIRDDLFDTLGTGHRDLAHIELAEGTRAFTFTADTREMRVDLATGNVGAQPPSYLLLGIDRMLTGLAQLLLIVALVAGTDSARAALSAIVSFAAGYCVTLVLTATGLILLSPVVAALLAGAAAAAAAALNLFPLGALAPGATASGLLGALQGFSLAQPLSGTPMLPGERTAALLHFSLGLAAATVLIAIVAFPLWRWLWQRWARRARAGISWPILLAGLALCFSGT